MPRPRKALPTYLEHKASGRGRAVWTDKAGVQQQRLLPGAFKSPESVAAFGKLLLELQVSPVDPGIPEKQRKNLTVSEVLLAYVQHASTYYRDADGKPTTPLVECKLVIRSLRELYGEERAAEFGPLKLKAVREGWVAGGLSRGEVNRRTGIVKRIWKWAAAEELVPVATWQALTAVAGLAKGRTSARDPEPVGPVEDATVDATLPHLNRHVRGLVEFQRLTGCRPGEACKVRLSDIDTSGPVWLFRLAAHKTAHKGKSRVVAIGPKAQTLLKQFATDDAAEYLFSPSRATAEHHAGRAAKRKTPLYPSHAKHNKARRKKTPRRKPADRYNHRSYSHAVTRAAEKAGVEHWSPNQLRHSFATKVRKAHGLEGAQVALGHSKADVTQVYAERDQNLAAVIAEKNG